jgi:hypothetical protein
MGDKLMDVLATASAVIRSFNSKTRKFFARVLEAATLDQAEAKIDALQKRVRECELLIERQYFPYEKQFTAQDLFDWFSADERAKTPEIHPKAAHPMFGKSRIPWHKAWKFDPKITEFDFSDWFRLERFKEINGLPQVTAEWRRLFGNDIRCWKGDQEVVVTADSHPYLKKMYPFIWIARIPIERIGIQTDQISYLVTLVLEWASKFTGENVKTSLSINRIVVLGNKQAYVTFRYDFYDLQAIEVDRGKTKWPNYYLFRQVVLATSGHYVYFVSVGEPRRNPHKQTEYADHIQRWLKEFQLGIDE